MKLLIMTEYSSVHLANDSTIINNVLFINNTLTATSRYIGAPKLCIFEIKFYLKQKVNDLFHVGSN